MDSSSRTCSLIFGALGIYAAFMCHGRLQEDIFDFTDAEGKKFNFVWVLQSIEALANVIVGFIGMTILGRTTNFPIPMSAITGTSCMFAKACMSLSLTNGLSYPAATLAKSAKMAPVIVGSIFIGGKIYPLRQYVQMAAIIVGAAMVSMNSKKFGGGEASTPMGVLFICISLTFDGLTGGAQDRLKTVAKQRGAKAKPYDMMFWQNVFMFLVAIAVALIPYPECELLAGILYIQANPNILQMIVTFAACSALGQSFIFLVIAEFGALKVTAVTTTRKIFSVLLSIFTKGHVLSPMGWAGVVVGSLGIAGELIPESKEEPQARVALVSPEPQSEVEAKSFEGNSRPPAPAGCL